MRLSNQEGRLVACIRPAVGAEGVRNVTVHCRRQITTMDKTVSSYNQTLTLNGYPAEVFDALKGLVCYFQLSTEAPIPRRFCCVRLIRLTRT